MQKRSGRIGRFQVEGEPRGRRETRLSSSGQYEKLDLLLCSVKA